MKHILIALLIGTTVHAGRFKSFCERCFIAHDPHQYDYIPPDAFVEMYRREGVEVTLGNVTNERLKRLGQRMRRLPPTTQTLQAMEDYGYLEDLQ